MTTWGKRKRQTFSFALSVAVVSVGVQGAPLHAQQVAYAANVAAELDSATQAAVAREIFHARERGIPVEPLVAKVREGRLKRAAGPRIRTAVAALAIRLDSARAALGAASSSEELIAGADALAAGADGTSLRALRAATTRPIAAPIGTLAQLVASGVAPSRAVEMIVTLLRKNATPAQLLALGNLVEVDVSTGLRAEDAAAIRLRGIEASLPSLVGGDYNTQTYSLPKGTDSPPITAGIPGTGKPPTPKRQP